MDAQEQFDRDARQFLREFSQQRSQFGPRAGSGRADAHWLQGAVLLFFAQWARAPWSNRGALGAWPKISMMDSQRRLFAMAPDAQLAFPPSAIGSPDPLSASALACAFLALQPPVSRKSALPAPLPCNALDSAATLFRIDPSLTSAPAAALRPSAPSSASLAALARGPLPLEPSSSAAAARARLLGASLPGLDEAPAALPIGQAAGARRADGMPSLASLLVRPDASSSPVRAANGPAESSADDGEEPGDANLSAAAKPRKKFDPAIPLSLSSVLLAQPSVEGLRVRRLKFGAPGQAPYFSNLALLSADRSVFSPAGLRERFEAWLDALPTDPALFAAAAMLAQDVRERQSHLAQPADAERELDRAEA